MKTVGDKIKERRIELGMTQEELGNKVGVQRAAINKYEKNIVENIKRSTQEKLAEALGLSPAELFYSEDEDLQLENIYMSFAKEAQDEGIDPNDIKDALALIRKLRAQK